jgi:hypothetical protein
VNALAGTSTSPIDTDPEEHTRTIQLGSESRQNTATTGSEMVTISQYNILASYLGKNTLVSDDYVSLCLNQ